MSEQTQKTTDARTAEVALPLIIVKMLPYNLVRAPSGDGPFLVEVEMDLQEYREKYKDIIEESIEPGVRVSNVRMKPTVSGTTFEEFDYKGFRLCHSTITGKWWVMDQKFNHKGWADNWLAATKVVDWVIMTAER